MAKKKNRRNIVGEFDAYFGAGTVQDWQRLCRDVGLTDNFTSITQCRKVWPPLEVEQRPKQLANKVTNGRL